MDRDVGKVYKKYDKWGKTYNISFSIVVDKLNERSNWDNVFHFTNGVNCCHQGNRIPGKTLIALSAVY